MNNPKLAGACFTIHGKLFLANGNPTYRILRLGTRRILGVLCDEDPLVPSNLESAIRASQDNAWSIEYFADYKVC
ncbi:MAG TPA: hypothetical protein VMT58_03425, partial [Candidatus Binataceae bacterium]|nr:hypothetical protein [Candidatus Binataceae bacterium]